MKTPIYCLTLHRPWGYAIAYLGKDVENRGQPCKLPIGTFIAIHHGRKWDESALGFIHRLQSQGIIQNKLSLPNQDNCPPFEIIAIAQFAGCVEHSDSPWFCGPHGWKLAHVMAIDPGVIICDSQVALRMGF